MPARSISRTPPAYSARPMAIVPPPSPVGKQTRYWLPSAAIRRYRIMICVSSPLRSSGRDSKGSPWERRAGGATRYARCGSEPSTGERDGNSSLRHRRPAQTARGSAVPDRPGAYLDDLAFDGLTHAIVLRSPHAHARIDGIDTQAARAMPGVLAVLTAADARADGLQAAAAHGRRQYPDRRAFRLRAAAAVLAADKVRYVGEPVALIVAETREQALDAAELVAVDYAPLPAVTSAAAARAPGAPQIARRGAGQSLLRLADRRHGERSPPPLPRRRMSSSSASTTTASSPTRSSRAAWSASTTRNAAAIRRMSRARASTRPATIRPARSACRRRRCALSRPMSAAALARKISSIPSTC